MKIRQETTQTVQKQTKHSISQSPLKHSQQRHRRRVSGAWGGLSPPKFLAECHLP